MVAGILGHFWGGRKQSKQFYFLTDAQSGTTGERGDANESDGSSDSSSSV